MTPTIPASSEVSNLINEAWEGVIQVCNTALHHADVFGYQLMSLPEPNLAALYNNLNFSAIPVLEKLLTDYDFDHDDGRKLMNMKLYLNLLKDIVLAIEADKEEVFTKTIETLKNQSFI
jgi:hypothetical protein